MQGLVSIHNTFLSARSAQSSTRSLSAEPVSCCDRCEMNIHVLMFQVQPAVKAGGIKHDCAKSTASASTSACSDAEDGVSDVSQSTPSSSGMQTPSATPVKGGSREIWADTVPDCTASKVPDPTPVKESELASKGERRSGCLDTLAEGKESKVHQPSADVWAGATWAQRLKSGLFKSGDGAAWAKSYLDTEALSSSGSEMPDAASPVQQTSGSSSPECDESDSSAAEEEGIEAMLKRDGMEALLPQVPRDANGNLTSVGSIPHAAESCKPCVFAFNNRKPCQGGVRCTFCHFEHAPKRRVRVGKQKRTEMKRLDELQNHY